MASGSETAVALRPTTVREAADLLVRSSRLGRTVSIEREGGDAELSTAGLARVVEHQAGDLIATVEAGIRLSALNAHLSAAGQMLALDPPGDPTVGGALAGNLSGPRRHRYGSPRDLVLGVTVVLADGTVTSSGGKVVKNVAGYDLGKLFVGSEGRYGLIARAALRLHPLPAAARSLIVPVGSAEEARDLAQALHRSQLVPSAVDLIWQSPRSRLLVLFEGSERAVAAQVDSARALCGGEEAGAEIWDEARALQAAAGGRFSFPPGRLDVALRSMGPALVRPLAGSAFPAAAVEDEGDAGARRLAERIRVALDPEGLLA